jgi:HrpA-like RNA helicase
MLTVKPISRGQCEQRAGRAGRLGPGTCRVMMTSDEYSERPELPEPEIRRCNLASVVLHLLSLQVTNVATFPFIDPPKKSAVNAAFRHLQLLDAVDPDMRVLTVLGQEMSKFPVDPMFARMIVAGYVNHCL